MELQGSVLVTGVSGNLGMRLLPLLTDRRVVGVDIHPPSAAAVFSTFSTIDLAEEDSCQELIRLLRETETTEVVHLAFVLDPRRTGLLDLDRMWRVNVAGTARVMEAITEVNRFGGKIRKFIYPSSAAVYGPETPGPVTESHLLGAHTLPYALHKRQADEVVRYRADTLGDCSVYVLRPRTFTGADVETYLLEALRGIPAGTSRRAERWRTAGKRIPLVLPYGKEYLEKKIQFTHVDDVARLMAWLLHHQENRHTTEVFNVAAHGEPLTLQQCVEIAHTQVRRVPGKWACKTVLEKLWNWGVSSIPPEALPYLIGSCTVDTSRLKKFLGADYASVIQYDVASALADSFRTPPSSVMTADPSSIYNHKIQ